VRGYLGTDVHVLVVHSVEVSQKSAEPADVVA
jgi:hypothetical protein